MKQQIYVAIALMLAILVAGEIIITGSSGIRFLPVYILSFLLIFFAATIFIARSLLEDRILAVSIILVFVAISATLLVTDVKTYYDAVNMYGAIENSSEIVQMRSQNAYYEAYVNYLNQTIMQYQNQTGIMELKLAELERLKSEQAQVGNDAVQNITSQVIIPQSTPPETSYITYSEPRQGERNDD